jgi:hypothetical protein
MATGEPGACKLAGMPARDQRMLLAAAVATSALLLLAALAGHAELLAYAAPLFLVALPLLAGRYPGEERLDRLRSEFVARRRPARVAPAPAVRRSAVLVPRGGRLIAEALAVRPPPVLVR